MTANIATASKSKVRHSPMEHPRHQYPEETKALQEIARSCGLVETIKWGKPCFTLGEGNIVLIQRFNKYIALLFFKGALLKDPADLLCRVGKNMHAPRQLRFSTIAEVERLQPTITAYIREAIELERTGAKVQPQSATELGVPHELQVRLDTSSALKNAFASLTPGRRRGYLFHISAAKQSNTRASRVDRNIPRILAGKGLRD